MTFEEWWDQNYSDDVRPFKEPFRAAWNAAVKACRDAIDAVPRIDLGDEGHALGTVDVDAAISARWQHLYPRTAGLGREEIVK